MDLLSINKSQIFLSVLLIFIFCMAGLLGFFINEVGVIVEDWQINLPLWAIPLWAITPIWSFLYLFLAISQWALWIEDKNLVVSYKFITLFFWCIQILLSGLWPVIFYIDPLGKVCIYFTIALLISSFICITIYYKIYFHLAVVIECWYFLWCCYLVIFVFSLQRINS